MELPKINLRSTYIKAHNRFFLRVFLIALFLLAILIGGAFYSAYMISFDQAEQNMVDNEALMCQLHEDLITDAFNQAISTMVFFSTVPGLNNYINDPTPEHKTALSHSIQSFSTLNPYFDQIRILDIDGYEKIRVNRSGTTGVIVPDEELQYKGDRYYLADLKDTYHGEIYVSPWDLNIEHGALELPYKPTMRIGMPLKYASGERYGFILINIDMRVLLDRFVLGDEANEVIGNINFLENDGYYLFNEIEPDTAFGSVLPERADHNFALEHPTVWREVLANKEGHIRVDGSIFTYQNIDLNEFEFSEVFGDKFRIKTSSPNYYLVFELDPGKIALIEKDLSGLRNVVTLCMTIVVPLLAYLAGILGSLLNENRKIHIFHATHDPLTGLGNRKLLALRFGGDPPREGSNFSALLFFDLDDFKDVNDTYGHAAGDTILSNVSQRVNDMLRKNDTLARVGGDEFVVVIRDTFSEQDAINLCERVIKAVNEPVLWNGQNLAVGASVGIYLPGNNAVDLDHAISMADKAMYQSKAAGKNRCALLKDRPA